MRRTLVLMAELPDFGDQKANESSPSVEGSRLGECFLLDMLERAQSTPDTEVIIAYSPKEALSCLQNADPCADGFILREGDSVGEAAVDCFQRLCQPGRSVVVLGNYNPTLPAMSIELAFDILGLGKVDLVLGPTTGGGCYLAGMSAAHSDLLSGLDWDAPDTIDAVIERCAGKGLDWYMLPVWENSKQLGKILNLK